MKKTYEAKDIQKFLPHRYPFLLIDRVEDYVAGKSLIAIKNVTANEPQFMGHFPGNPVMPGVMIVEAMAQATGVLSHLSKEEMLEGTTVYYLASIDKCRFRRIVIPGDQLKIEVQLQGVPKRNIWKFKASATVAGDLAASCEIMCAAR